MIRAIPFRRAAPCLAGGNGLVLALDTSDELTLVFQRFIRDVTVARFANLATLPFDFDVLADGRMQILGCNDFGQ